jgi:DNA-binding transcriptional LysR family regulator
MIELQWEAFSLLNEPEVRGEITFGVPEDFATHYLPDILASFAKHHPHVQLHVTCNLTLNLMKAFQKGDLDIVLVKRDPESVKGGTKVWREPLVWAAAEHYQIKNPIPLILSPQPCIYRARALGALDRMRKSWQVTYTSPSLAGTIAAVKAGLGITVLPANMVPQGLAPIRGPVKLPHLADSEIALFKKEQLSAAGQALAAHIIKSLEQNVRYEKK